MTAPGNGGATTRATAALRAYLAEHGLRVHAFDTPTPTSPIAAEALGCAVGQIAKTLLFRVGERHVAVIASGDARVRQARLKRATGFPGKVRMADAAEVTARTGYAPGGVSPFLLPDALPRLLDASLARFDVVYPAAGDTHSLVAIGYERLRELSGATEAEVCELPQD